MTLPNVYGYPGDRADKCEYSDIPRVLKPGERVLHWVAEPNIAGDVQKCFRCGRILSDEGMGAWPSGTWLEERKANNYTEWTVI